MTDYDELPDSPLERALTLQSMVVGLSQGGNNLDQYSYRLIRTELMNDAATRVLVPRLVQVSRTRDELWAYLKTVATGTGSWAERERHIYDAFRPLLDFLERPAASPADESIDLALESYDAEGVHSALGKGP
ncbi:MAG: hypothetical protein Rhirs2KO_11410 [Rhizobiaceae bacterium]